MNRDIFDGNGNTMCVVTKYPLKLSDIVDITRDNRVDIRDEDLQMGHVIPRSDDYFTITGFNLVPMSRKGNLMIGEDIFTENKWITDLHRLASLHMI